MMAPEEAAGHILTGCEYVNIPIPLANLVGLNGAVILKAIENWCISNARHKKKSYFRNGYWWTHATYQDWLDQFKFLGSTRSVQRTVLELEKQGLIISEHCGRKKFDQTKWYRLNRKELGSLYLKEFGDIFNPPDEAETTQIPIVPNSDDDSAKFGSTIVPNSDALLLDQKELIEKEQPETPNRVSEPSPPKSLSLSDLEKANQETQILQPNTSVALIEKNQIFGAQPISSPGSKDSAAAFLPPEEIVIISPRENSSQKFEDRFTERANGLPCYRDKRGVNGLKKEFIEAIAKHLSGTPHYLNQNRRASAVDAKNHILRAETEGQQELMVDRYRELCPTPKSTGVEATTNTHKVQTQTESLTSRVKGNGLMSKWNALHTEV